ncbi:hypothetical protein BV25DRAFT_1836579 [Artomyces pyxidatus]|uniref:Uncharacterized protein n=1 Tax=Artomyces pyxidatus TaxID=48021 RepID=A0ACB8TAE0_9AGAM|nr:hypothetical protein BV25DRAFT_1836579 [Artomyces pyxidatus]
MTDYVRRLVSGQKARFKDGDLKVELDLSYITDQVIVMGYPATGIEGLYRNRREDAKKFLEHRHGNNFWVFNFCPVRENSYDASVFDGRVSRYPFPDHHAPPLAILALVSREIRLWLDGSPDRVAVLHCKAGKGRSGTLACAYLLSLDNRPTPPRLERNYVKKDWEKVKKNILPPQAEDATITDIHPERGCAQGAGETEAGQSEAKKEWAKERAEELMNEMPADDAIVTPHITADTDADELSQVGVGSAVNFTEEVDKRLGDEVEAPTRTEDGVTSRKGAREDSTHTKKGLPKESHVESAVSLPSAPAPTVFVSPAPGEYSTKTPAKPAASTLADVLKLHTSRRMRASTSSSSSSSSISDISKVEAVDSTPGPPPKKGRQGVSIPSQRRWLYYWSLLLSNGGPTHFWPPLPHPPTSPDYTPQPKLSRVRLLDVKVRMREPKGVKVSAIKAASHLLGLVGQNAKPQGGSEYGLADLWVSLARYDDTLVDTLERWERWSREIGIGGFGRRRRGGDHIPRSKAPEQDDAAGKTNAEFEEGIQDVFKEGKWDQTKMVRSFAKLGVVPGQEVREGKIITETLRASEDGAGVVLDANREVRFKIYMGKVFLCWFWLIPVFHVSDLSPDAEPTTMTFKKSDLDFPIGLGSSLIDVQLTFQPMPADAPSEPPSRAMSGQSEVDVVQEKRGGVLEGAAEVTAIRTGLEVQQGLQD